MGIHINKGEFDLKKLYVGQRLWHRVFHLGKMCKPPGETPMADFNQTAFVRKWYRANTAGTYYKDICLLPSPTWECVPCGKVKITLIQKDIYIDA